MTQTKSFEQWMAAVDAEVQAKIGLSIYDLPDCCYADWHEDGFTPKQAARKALRAANGDDE